MESVKQQSSQRTVIVSIGVAAVALAAAISALTLTVYQDNIIRELTHDGAEMRQQIQELREMMECCKNKLEFADMQESQVRKRSVGDGQEVEDDFNQLSRYNIELLRGPPGRDGRDGADGSDGANGRDGDDGRDGTNGRDGRDGKDFDISDVDKLITQIFQRLPVSETPEENRGNQSRGISRGGSTYVRWGRTTCASTSEMIYSGFVAGQKNMHTGGASNYQCLPLQPEFSRYNGGDTYGNYIYGAEYQVRGNNLFSESLHDRNVPCARCYVPTRSASMMIPAKVNCPTGWTKEYSGYLMAGKYDHKRAYAYECVDGNPEALPGLTADTDGALFFFQQIRCSYTGHCPPFIEGAELACVVCTK